MRKIRFGLIVVGMLLCMANSVSAQVSIGIGLPSVSIRINLPLFPELVPVPGYPVYYAPSMDANYFFYDGMYWVYLDDNWYASSWYNGPWGIVDPYYVPLFILRIPVSYYRQPPAYFRGWLTNAPPRWDQHWGRDWEQRRSGWDRWNRGSVPKPAPLPVYQRQYTGDRYPSQLEQQQTLRSKQYRYQPRETAVREHFQQLERRAPAPAQRGRQEAPPARSPSQVDQRQQQKQQVDQQQNDQRQKQQKREQKQQVDQRQQQKQQQQSDQRQLQQQREQKQQVDQRQQQKQQNDQRQLQQQREQKQQVDQGQQQQQREQKQPVDQRQQQKQQRDQRQLQQQKQQQQQPAPAQRQPPKVKEQEQRPQDSGESQEPDRGQGQNKDDEERGRGRNK